MHTSTDLHAKTRGPPRRGRVMRPLRPAAMQGGPVASANLRGQTPAPKQTRFAGGPDVAGRPWRDPRSARFLCLSRRRG